MSDLVDIFFWISASTTVCCLAIAYRRNISDILWNARRKNTDEQPTKFRTGLPLEEQDWQRADGGREKRRREHQDEQQTKFSEDLKDKEEIKTIDYASSAESGSSSELETDSWQHHRQRIEQNLHIWMRSETKDGEHRMPMCPPEAKQLVEAGFRVTVEQSPMRCMPIEDYASVGCEVAPEGSWRTLAPENAIVLGLKEIEGEDPLKHRHIMFFHCFKGQSGWRETIHRFTRGGGVLYDLEFLKFADGKRIAAFGVSAGQMGSALGIKTWYHQKLGTAVPPTMPWDSVAKCIAELTNLGASVSSENPRPRVVVIGARGRCGRGAVQIAEGCGLETVKWGRQETTGNGPFPALLDFDIVVNCVYLEESTPVFVNREMLYAATSSQKDKRRFSVLADVSCDYDSANNPFPFYCEGTTHEVPALRCFEGSSGEEGNSLSMDVVAIDNLPTLIAKEAATEYSQQLVHQLLNLNKTRSDPVWLGALAHFKKCQELANAYLLE